MSRSHALFAPTRIRALLSDDRLTRIAGGTRVGGVRGDSLGRGARCDPTRLQREGQASYRERIRPRPACRYRMERPASAPRSRRCKARGDDRLPPPWPIRPTFRHKGWRRMWHSPHCILRRRRPPRSRQLRRLDIPNRERERLRVRGVRLRPPRPCVGVWVGSGPRALWRFVEPGSLCGARAQDPPADERREGRALQAYGLFDVGMSELVGSNAGAEVRNA